MEKVAGIGGIFFKASDPKALQAWYAANLGLPVDENGTIVFEGSEGQTVWSLFPRDTTYFAPSTAPFMVNYRVTNLEAMLAQLRAAGARVDEKIDSSEFGKFGWALDPEGNRIELWEPPRKK